MDRLHRLPEQKYGEALMASRGSSVREQRLAFVLLLAVALVWGSTFALVKSALADASPLVFNLLRFTLAALALLLIGGSKLRKMSRQTLLGGALAGVFLAAGYELQTSGLARTTAIHSALLTGLVVVFVPILSFVPRLRALRTTPPGWSAIVGAGLAFLGLVLLTTPAGTRVGELMGGLGRGDLLTLGCALAFSAHLLTLSRLAHLPAVQLTALQISVCAATMLLCLPWVRPAVIHPTPRLITALAITALLATTGAFLVQTWAQKHLTATATAMILTLEPIFALLFSMAFLGERLNGRAALGAALILIGIAAAELLTTARPLPFEAT